jgi:DNA-binding CsgD family transcriptional regulator
MADERFERLNLRQKACLRQVSELRVACEIAAELGTSEAMVNKLIKEACEKIGVNRRKEAARLFAEYENRVGVPKLDVHSRDLGTPSLPGVHEASSEQRATPLVVREARASFEGDLDTLSTTLPPSQEHVGDKVRVGIDLSVKMTAILAMVCLAALLLSKFARAIEALLNLHPR